MQHMLFRCICDCALAIRAISVVIFFRPFVPYNLAYNLICIVDGAVDVMWSMQYFLETCGSKLVLVCSQLNQNEHDEKFPRSADLSLNEMKSISKSRLNGGSVKFLIAS